MADLDWSPLQRAINEIESSLIDAEDSTAVPVERLSGQIDQVTRDEAPGLLDAVFGIITDLGELVSGLLGNLSEVDDFWSALIGYVATEYDQLTEAVMALSTSYAATSLQTLAALVNAGMVEVRGAATALAGSGPRSPAKPDDIKSLIDSMPLLGRSFVDILTIGLTAVSFAGAFQSANISALQQASMAEAVPTPLSLAMLTELVKRGNAGVDWARDHAKRTGFSSELFDRAMDLEQQRLTADHYIHMWLRSGDEAHLSELPKLGISDGDVGRLRELALAIATPSDLIRFLVRDVFDADAVRRGDLDADFDAKYREDVFQKSGVSEELARQYWRAHWELPSPAQGYEMLHREQLDMDGLRALIKQADYAPAYVDKLINIAYLQPGRIDLRRMWEVGIITERDELIRRYKYLGYNDADSIILADFSITLADRSRANEAARKRAPLIAQVSRAFVQGTLSEADTRASLLSIGLTEADAEIEIREGILARERDRADRIRDSLGRQYVRGHLSRDDLAGRLAAYGFGPEEIAFNVESWELDRELRELSELEQRERDLSRADIVAAFSSGLMTGDEAYATLVQIGYAPNEADTILELEAAKQARADAKAEQDALRVSYLGRRIDAAELRRGLERIRVPAERIDSLVRQWTVQREERTPDLPAATLERLIFHALISQDDARSELERRGYTDQETDWYLRLWGEEVSVARDRLEQQGEQFDRRLEQQAQLAAGRLSVQERALELRDRTATTAQLLQQDRFTQSLEQRERLQTQRLDSASVARAETAARTAERDAALFAQRQRLSARNIQAQDDRLTRQIEAADTRQSRALTSQQELQGQRNAIAAQAQQAQNERQSQRLSVQVATLERRIGAQVAAAEQAQADRISLESLRQDFQRQVMEANRAADEAERIANEASRIRQEQRAELSTIRREERTSARSTIAREDAAIAADRLRSLQLQRDELIASLTAQLAGLEASAAEQRILEAENRSAEARQRLGLLVGPALTFDSVT